MDKKIIESIVRKAVEDAWYNHRSINPITEQTQIITDEIYKQLIDLSKQPLTEETEEGFKEWTDEKCICLTETFIQQIFTHYKLIKREK